MQERKNRLTLIRFVERDKAGRKRNLYQCECGKQIVARESNVKSGNTKSCGCLNKETAVKNGKQSGNRRRLKQLFGAKDKRNKTGVTGVSYWKRTKQWVAELTYKKKRYRVCCKSKEEAIEARLQLEKDLGIYEGIL